MWRLEVICVYVVISAGFGSCVSSFYTNGSEFRPIYDLNFKSLKKFFLELLGWLWRNSARWREPRPSPLIPRTLLLQIASLGLLSSSFPPCSFQRVSTWIGNIIYIPYSGSSCECLSYFFIFTFCSAINGDRTSFNGTTDFDSCERGRLLTCLQELSPLCWYPKANRGIYHY